MAYTRALTGPETRTVRIACSTCGFTYLWPQEIRRESDGKYRCLVGAACADDNNLVEHNRRVALSQKRREDNQHRPPGAPSPGYE